jgi:urea carboxylase-associated protein 2
MDISDELIVWDETIPGGAYWTRVVPRWATLRVTDVEGAGACALLAYNAGSLSERYNAPDTTKVQNMIFLTEGWLLLSDLGRVLLSITADGCGHHETLAGGTTAGTVRAKYGDGSYLRLRNDRYTNDRDNFIAALGRHGLDTRDIVPNVNLFSRVEVGEDGALRYIPGVSRPGAWIDLRAELDVLVAVSATPHVLDPSPVWRPGPVRLTVWRSPAPQPDDRCRTRTDEARRAFDNTDSWWAQRPSAA